MACGTDGITCRHGIKLEEFHRSRNRERNWREVCCGLPVKTAVDTFGCKEGNKPCHVHDKISSRPTESQNNIADDGEECRRLREGMKLIDWPVEVVLWYLLMRASTVTLETGTY